MEGNQAMGRTNGNLATPATHHTAAPWPSQLDAALGRWDDWRVLLAGVGDQKSWSATPNDRCCARVVRWQRRRRPGRLPANKYTATVALQLTTPTRQGAALIRVRMAACPSCGCRPGMGPLLPALRCCRRAV